MTRLRLTRIDEYQFLTCLKHSLWGSKSKRFGSWQLGDFLAFKVDKALAALAEVSGEPFYSREEVWHNDLYPHRIPIRFTHVLAEEDRVPILGAVRDALTSEWGPSYGWGILNQKLLTGNAAQTIVDEITSHPNSLAQFVADIDQLLLDAKPSEPLEETDEGEEIQPVKPRREREFAHSRAQALLIRLARITGCRAFIAANDRTRLFRGKPLGEDCLESLPSIGLSSEATSKISMIDVIWLRDNAPVCAFEVEVSTSVYSGLLRMSDLLAVVPALKVSLFVVAQKERQAKVMQELGRPTFRKIGLSEFCRFVAMEDLESLVAKVSELTGYVQPSVIERIAIGLED